MIQEIFEIVIALVIIVLIWKFIQRYLMM